MSEAEQRLRRHVLDLQTKLQACDHQLAALRELFSLENTTDDDGQCISCWTDIGNPERPEPHSTNCVLERARALVVPPPANQQQSASICEHAVIGLHGLCMNCGEHVPEPSS